MTDVTGFGLAGHLYETIGEDPVQARIKVSDLPLLAGSAEVLARGWESSLQSANRRWVEAHIGGDTKGSAVVFDPQTAGPLLAGVPGHRADDCIAALRECGYVNAAIIGEIVAREPGDPIRIQLESA